MSDQDTSGVMSAARAAFHSNMVTKGLGRTGGQAPQPRKRCAGGAGLDGMAESQANLLISLEWSRSDTARQIKSKILQARETDRSPDTNCPIKCRLLHLRSPDVR